MINEKDKITKVGQKCRKCATPVTKKEVAKKRLKIGQQFYWKSYLHCPGCNTMYFVESEKVFVMDERFDWEQEKTMLFFIFRQIMDKHNISQNIQKDMWEELEKEYGNIKPNTNQ